MVLLNFRGEVLSSADKDSRPVGIDSMIIIIHIMQVIMVQDTIIIMVMLAATHIIHIATMEDLVTTVSLMDKQDTCQKTRRMNIFTILQQVQRCELAPQSLVREHKC